MSFIFGILWLVTPIVALLGLGLAYKIYADILTRPDGSERMREIAGAIREGALAYLKQQSHILIPVAAAVFFIIWASGLGFQTAIAYLLGAGSSLFAGFVGMKAATMANVRTAQAASENKPGDALLIAFNGGAVMGLAVASLAVIGLGFLFYIFGTPASFEPMIGFGMGASSVALFARIGGGIYTKAADVGSDLVGKVEAGIPEDDPRNPGVVADNVGDNVGDVAGMGADWMYGAGDHHGSGFAHEALLLRPEHDE
jgi:K(+)-stimulated pyrophosphate-energized sodium pump